MKFSTYSSVRAALALRCAREGLGVVLTLPEQITFLQSNSCNAPTSNQQIQSKRGISCKTLNCKPDKKKELIKE